MRQPAAGIFVRDVMHKNCAVNQDCLWPVMIFVLLLSRLAVRMFPRFEMIPAATFSVVNRMFVGPRIILIVE